MTMKMKCAGCGDTTEFELDIDAIKTIDGHNLKLWWLCIDCGYPHHVTYELVSIRTDNMKEGC